MFSLLMTSSSVSLFFARICSRFSFASAIMVSPVVTLASAAAPQSFPFLRQGYFAVDSKDSRPGALVFNRAVALKDSFKK